MASSDVDILEIEDAIQDLGALASKNKLIAFAGSGISAQPPSNLPVWDEFVDRFLAFCEKVAAHAKNPAFEHTVRTAKNSPHVAPSHAATVLRNALSKLKTDINIEDLFQDWFEGVFRAQPNALHEYLVATNYAYLLTSNYDMLLEDAAKRLGIETLTLRSFSLHDAPHIANVIYSGEPAIIHVHGKLRHLGVKGIVLTHEDYIEVRRKYPGFRFAFHSLLLRYSTLFVGYGASDPHLEDVFDELGHYLRDDEGGLTLPRNYLVVLRKKATEVYKLFKAGFRTRLVVIDEFDDYKRLLAGFK